MTDPFTRAASWDKDETYRTALEWAYLMRTGGTRDDPSLDDYVDVESMVHADEEAGRHE